MRTPCQAGLQRSADAATDPKGFLSAESTATRPRASIGATQTSSCLQVGSTLLQQAIGLPALGLDVRACRVDHRRHGVRVAHRSSVCAVTDQPRTREVFT